MPPNFYRRLQLITLAISLFSMSSPFAQDVDYPKGPVKLIVPIGAGGGTDILGRKVAQKLAEILKQSTFVENKAGAGSLIGTDFVAKASPDGYTLLVGGLFKQDASKVSLSLVKREL